MLDDTEDQEGEDIGEQQEVGDEHGEQEAMPQHRLAR